MVVVIGTPRDDMPPILGSADKPFVDAAGAPFARVEPRQEEMPRLLHRSARIRFFLRCRRHLPIQNSRAARLGNITDLFGEFPALASDNCIDDSAPRRAILFWEHARTFTGQLWVSDCDRVCFASLVIAAEGGHGPWPSIKQGD